MDELVVYNDIRKLVSVGLSFLIIAGLVGFLGVYRQSTGVLLVIVAAICALLLVGFVWVIRKAISREPIFSAGENGVTDLSRPDDPLFLTWDQVMRIELKAANNNDLMLDVFGFKTKDQLEGLSPDLLAQVDANGGMAYFMMEVSGMWLTRSHMLKTFEDLKQMAVAHNPQIQCMGFDDPLSKSAREREKSRKKAMRAEVAAQAVKVEQAEKTDGTTS